MLVLSLVIVLLGWWWNFGGSAKKAEGIIRESAEHYILSSTDDAIRANNYFVSTANNELVVFDLGLYLADYGATNMSCNSEYDKSTSSLSTVYNCELNGAKISLISKYYFDGKLLWLQSSDVAVTYPQTPQGAVQLRTANSELSRDNDYVLYDRTAPIKFHRSTLGQLCYVVQNGYWNFGNAVNDRTSLQKMGFVPYF